MGPYEVPRGCSPSHYRNFCTSGRPASKIFLGPAGSAWYVHTRDPEGSIRITVVDEILLSSCQSGPVTIVLYHHSPPCDEVEILHCSFVPMVNNVAHHTFEHFAIACQKYSCPNTNFPALRFLTTLFQEVVLEIHRQLSMGLSQQPPGKYSNLADISTEPGKQFATEVTANDLFFEHLLLGVADFERQLKVVPESVSSRKLVSLPAHSGDRLYRPEEVTSRQKICCAMLIDAVETQSQHRAESTFAEVEVSERVPFLFPWRHPERPHVCLLQVVLYVKAVTYHSNEIVFL